MKAAGRFREQIAVTAARAGGGGRFATPTAPRASAQRIVAAGRPADPLGVRTLGSGTPSHWDGWGDPMQETPLHGARYATDVSIE